MVINNYLSNVKKYIINFYKIMTIKRKVFIILATLVLIISMLSFLLLQVTFKVYDRQLINNSSEILNIYSTNIENELRKVESLSFGVITSNQTQEYLSTINNKKSSYERYVAISKMEDILRNQSQSESYISSVSLVDINGSMYTVGNSTITIANTIQNEVMKRLEKKSGGFVWIEPKEDNKNFILARKIRSISNFKVIGTLIIRIDADNLVNSVSNMSPQYKANLIILSENKNMIYKDKKITSAKAIDIGLNNMSNEIYNIDGKKFLLNREVSNYSKWTYVNFLSYENIFQNIKLMRTIMLCCFLMIFILAVSMGLGFAGSITKPIITLSKKMKKVENGNFEIMEIDKISDDKCDEVGQLNNDFIVMVNKINELIKENYIKQILVKETELKALQSQINPHFLYNTLDSINWIAKANKEDKISLMVKSLSNLFRASIASKDSIIKIEDELKLLNDYINIQKIRYEERLDFSDLVDEDIKECYILKMTLQPLVENCIKYGLEQLTGVCKITIKSQKQKDFLEVIVSDNGIGMTKEFLHELEIGENKSRSTGIGIKNIDERIKLFFGKEFGISVKSQLSEGTTVIVRIPYKVR
ncbi:cache domain-containing sensor histidine kinase [Clostridium estertheticum]|uniref:cache domain-containing sensor histidine kinase n=1 Tax=Clostridium estertheticum TaxID=238834 RepID=UPI001C0AEFFE|nr:sensor histidine kinase [Clostridium estertheticum]MBU3170713.1 sensor histidine kinase [Clostridium estertheticum]MCB2339357.1 sensor histidine kinase [Clostridium estertheticum]